MKKNRWMTWVRDKKKNKFKEDCYTYSSCNNPKKCNILVCFFYLQNGLRISPMSRKMGQEHIRYELSVFRFFCFSPSHPPAILHFPWFLFCSTKKHLKSSLTASILFYWSYKIPVIITYPSYPETASNMYTLSSSFFRSKYRSSSSAETAFERS